ncbi:MAG: hypothetical protein ACYSU0_23235, partial [Planctomycetota bacterium]
MRVEHRRGYGGLAVDRQRGRRGPLGIERELLPDGQLPFPVDDDFDEDRERRLPRLDAADASRVCHAEDGAPRGRIQGHEIAVVTVVHVSAERERLALPRLE